jgi:small conductance mechanosensitive channel
MMVLSGLGVEVGPLIAGAGIFGVAIGFGSQTLVKDVISGIFYMTDDAFRVGEYIQSGNYKGTVESFSIRSVKLRHHRGPIFTVPFGVLGAVENMSRDWVIDKFLISVSYQTDIALVKRLVKGVGAELLQDEELGPTIIETVKMKGVEQFGDYGINLSFAMTTKPGHQSTIRRRAYAMIRDAFTANGISFASPTVQVAGDERGAASAAAAANNAVALKAAAELKAAEG